MWKRLVSSITYPQWATDQGRFVRLDALDRFLDGTLYDHLEFSFYDEVDAGGNYVPIDRRVPSAQLNLPNMVSKLLARKLFAGRHAPRVTHVRSEVADWLRDVIAQGSLYERMLQACVWGSVGSVAVTFRIVENGLHVDIWRAKFCYPTFAPAGGLASLRVQYTVSGRVLLHQGFTVDRKGHDLSPHEQYWFVRDWTADAEITYIPIVVEDYDPYNGPANKDSTLEEDTARTIKHSLGMVPGVWMVNLSGGEAPDGVCTWEAAVSLAIDADYTLSQLGRGVRYNAAPQLVVIGDLKGDEDDRIQRGPVTVLQFPSAARMEDGSSRGGGDAKLLEMVGNGTQTGMKYIEYTRRLALEAVAVSRKNPEESRGTLSGRAMELMDDSFFDLVHELRSAYGEEGFGALLRKIAVALVRKGLAPPGIEELDARAFGLRWPRLYGATPQDEMSLIEGMAMATQSNLVDPETAKSYLWAHLDMEDYKTDTPITDGGADAQGDAPTTGTTTPAGDVYNEGTNTDLRRPGPQNTTLPARQVGKPQTRIGH